MKDIFPKFSNRHLYNIKDVYEQAGLDMSDELRELSNSDAKKLWNGIGAVAHWYNWLIPKTCGFLNVEICSADHDIAYQFGQTQEDKEAADARFKYNMITWIRLHTDPGYRCLLAWRIRRARENYWFVKEFGDAAYWTGKNKRGN